MVVKKKGKKGGGVSVDMSGVESGGRAVADGRYKAYPVECEEKEGESSGEPYLAFKWKITSKEAKNATLYDNCSLQPQALWRLKTLLEAMDMEVPDGVMEIDPDDLIGEDHEIEIEVTNEKYKGKNVPRISGFGGAPTEGESEDKDEEEEEEEEEEKPTPKKKVAGKADEKLGKSPKIKEGSKVKFTDDDDNEIKGTVTEIDGKTVKVEDKKGDEYELSIDDVELV